MLKAICDKYDRATPSVKNDIFRRFHKQFRYLTQYPVCIDSSEYVEQPTSYYDDEFTAFANSYQSDVRFFIGYTGVGKSTFIRHFFKLTNAAPKMYGKECIVIPSFWNGNRLSDNDYEKEIKENIVQSFAAAQHVINPNSANRFPIDDMPALIDYIRATKAGILYDLTPEEKNEYQDNMEKWNAAILTQTKMMHEVEYASSCLKYFLQKYGSQVKRVILVIDDVETLSSAKLKAMIELYFRVYACLHNTAPGHRLIINLLISLRPHSYRYLKYDLPHEQISSYGNYLDNSNYVIFRDDIPDIKRMFEKRFQYATTNTDEPRNKDSWQISQNALQSIVQKFDNQYVNMIRDLCHMNIRAIMDCFQMVLSNRVWCQETKEITEYPHVAESEYDFDNIVNVTRTLACGEATVYSSKYRNLFGANKAQKRLTPDNSDVFIPNLLINPETRECDVLALYIMIYLDYVFSEHRRPTNNSEFISVQQIVDEICDLLGFSATDAVFKVIEYLFHNRVIRKSIFDSDSESEINVVQRKNLIYFTQKGERLLKMLKADCVLLEVFREDMVREYKDDSAYKSSMELVNEKNRTQLFRDLIQLAYEIFQNEDTYVCRAYGSAKHKQFETVFSLFPVFRFICDGISTSLSRAQGIEEHDELQKELQEIIKQYKLRIEELTLRQ